LGSTVATQWFRVFVRHLLSELFCSFFFEFSQYLRNGTTYRAFATSAITLHV
jgi:hypothetical protein